MNYRQIFLSLVLSFSVGCGYFSTKSESPEETDDEIVISERTYKDVQGVRMSQTEFRKQAYEAGFDPETTLTPEQELIIKARFLAKQMERNLETIKERDQYSKILPWLKSDFEKIEFLNIPSIEGRQAWINGRKIWSRSVKVSQKMTPLISSGDIAVGMPQDLVRKSWGDPQTVEVSGNPVYRNERWKYAKQVSTAQGFRNEQRLVFFEGGRVVGWETE